MAARRRVGRTAVLTPLGVGSSKHMRLAGDQRSNQRAWVTGEEGEAKAGSDQAADRGGISAGMATTSLG